MTTKILDRTYPIGQAVELGVANMGADKGVSFSVPMGAIVVRVIALTTTAFDSETTATLTVSDGTTAFVSAQDVKTAGSETVANTPKLYPTGGTITASLAETGEAATTGAVFVYVEYVRPGNGIAGVQE